jgi:hypothetical protein
VFFFEIIFGLYFRITVTKDIRKPGGNLFYLNAGKLGTNPNNETCNFRHWLAFFGGAGTLS